MSGGGGETGGVAPAPAGGALVIDGRAVAARVRERVRGEVDRLGAERGVRPGLATVLVGDDPASELYVRRKREACAEAGIRSVHRPVPADTSAHDLASTLADLNADPSVHGILLQLPLPAGLGGAGMTRRIAPEKDVDGLHPVNAGLLAQGAPDAVAPCTPAGVIELLRAAGVELAGARAAVIGRSTLVGRPMASLLLAEDATVTHCHSRTRDLDAVCREAEVIVAAAGVPRLVTAGMVAARATVIDVGTNRTEEGLVGDVDFEAVREVAGAITPVPGGVGPMTIAMLLENTVRAARRSLARE
ncbi:MAG TPA: bifunctional 5,10-methylenetetrahydrofolate dehydrogenase/5,10-methenyltetrahydrofolate cyclohydrolase [Thermoleophilaceae bacterium]|nr:bifunctional 5,10-methylenetetrahydrofolate dehydrogenase/5,10-methenyltetrahydrofolate cyclohydrolase [Thermoleophilaceae bacterium]